MVCKTFSGTEPMKTEKVVLQLEEMIHRGDLRPGDRLPPERDLARFWCKPSDRA